MREVVPARAALARVVAAVDEVEDMEAVLEHSHHDIAHPCVVPGRRPELDGTLYGPRIRLRQARNGRRDYGEVLHAVRTHCGGRLLRPGNLLRAQAVLVIAFVNRHEPLRVSPAADRHLVRAVRTLQRAERNADRARAWNRRLNDGAAAVGRLEVEVVSKAVVQLVERMVGSSKAERHAHHARNVD